MRCKEGDIAVIVLSTLGNAGKFVRCIKLAEEFDGVWVIDKPLGRLMGQAVCLAEDYRLRPIRDPGDDARDQTLDWLPVPSTEKESA